VRTILELVQHDDGDIVLQPVAGSAEPGSGLGTSPEPLLKLRFSKTLTDILGADALTLAQAMVESASYAFEYAQEQQEEQRAAQQQALQAGGPAEPAETAPQGAQGEGRESIIRLQTTPIH